MPVDPRDCRLTIGMILGDPNIPDTPESRDMTCAWFNFVDNQYNSTIASQSSSTSTVVTMPVPISAVVTMV